MLFYRALAREALSLHHSIPSFLRFGWMRRQASPGRGSRPLRNERLVRTARRGSPAPLADAFFRRTGKGGPLMGDQDNERRSISRYFWRKT